LGLHSPGFEEVTDGPKRIAGVESAAFCADTHSPSYSGEKAPALPKTPLDVTYYFLPG